MNEDYIRAYELPQESEFDFKKWALRVISIWPWLLLSIVISISFSFVYMKMAHPIYEASAAILVKDESKGAEMIDNSSLKELGLGGNNKLVENETEVLQSPDLMENVAKQLKLYIDASRVAGIRTVSVFGNEIPFIIDVINPGDIRQVRGNNMEWIIGKNQNGYWFRNKSENRSFQFQYGKIYRSEGIDFRCTLNPNFVPDDELIADSDTSMYFYSLNLVPLNSVILNYGKKLKIDQATKLATVIDLEIRDNNQKKAVAILQSLIGSYNQMGLDDKNRVTDSTISFLNERLTAVSNDMRKIGEVVESFKTKNKVTDITTDVQQYMTLAQQVDQQKAQSETQLNIINALEENLEQNQNDPKLVPSTLGIEEPTLDLLIEKHNELILQKERVLEKSGPLNPLLIDLQEQIKEIRSRMLDNVINLKKAYSIAVNDVSKIDNRLTNKIQNVPQIEKKYLQITRDKDVQNDIYGFLLQKREEAEVTRASNLEDSRTIAQPRGFDKKWPKGILVFPIGFIIGLLIPLGCVYIKDLLHNKVGDSAQVAQFVNLPIIGSISHIKKIKSPVVIGSHSRSVASEQIRQIRTAISFTGKGKGIKKVLTTSFQPGDGKSFVSLNLAAGYALLEKKTVILEFDMRRSHLASDLGFGDREGLSSILSGKSTIDELLIELPGFNGHLFLLPAGIIPPNPVELISGARMEPLMKVLEKRFDYIVIDTPPFGIVADATLLQKFADISLVVLRQDHTSRDVYAQLKEQVSKRPDHSVYLLLNDVGKSKRYQGGYGYYYGKGYYNQED